MSEKRGTKALELWCKRMTEGYPGVKVENMTTSWRDGLAFCAMIHHFRPELIDFSKLNKDDVFYNNELAFTVAEKYLGIPALLEPEDMVEYDVPDRLSILTYLSQFYRTFVHSQGSSPARIVPKRPANSTDRSGISSPASTSPPSKMAMKSVGVPRRDPCAKCGNPIYIAERLNVGKLLYHRTCFRCARCNSQLTLANYYETETPNQFCCETCPDEESATVKGDAVATAKPDEKSMLSRSLSDEEKSAGLKKISHQQQLLQQQQDDYSASFETALETPSLLGTSEYSKARSQFMSANFVDSASDTEIPPELPKTKPPDIKDATKSPEIVPKPPSSSPPTLRIDTGRRESNLGEKTINSAISESKDKISANLHSSTRSSSSSSDNKNYNNRTNRFNVNQSILNKHDVTKDKPQINVGKDDNIPSIVKNRMKLFEKTNITEEKSDQNLKRPLADDTTVTSPEKKFSLERNKSDKKSPDLNSAFPKTIQSCDTITSENQNTAKTISTSPVKDPQTKSLDLLLQKQIALKDGKITPKSLISQIKSSSTLTQAKSADNLLKTRNLSSENLQMEKRKSLENLVVKPKFELKKIITEKKDNKIKPFLPPRKIEGLAEKPKPPSKESLKIDFKQTRKSSLGKSSLNRPTSLEDKKSDVMPSPSTRFGRLNKQQSMEDIPKVKPEIPKIIFNRHSRNERKENLFQVPTQNKCKSVEKLADNSKISPIKDYGLKKTLGEFPNPIRRSSSEDLFKSRIAFLSDPSKPKIFDYSIGGSDRVDYQRNKTRLSMYMSDTELNNILYRKDKDWPLLQKRKSMEYLPMRSIENLYRSNSEEYIGYKTKENLSNIRSDRNSVSALKNKFECLSVVQSSPSSSPVEKQTTLIAKDIDVENNSVSEIQSGEAHGEVLRNGHIIKDKDTEGRDEKIEEDSEAISKPDRSEDTETNNNIIIDLTTDNDSNADVICISDESVIEISDTVLSISKITEISEELSKSTDNIADYPEDLNPFGDDDDEKNADRETEEKSKKIHSMPVNNSLNPFEDDDNDDDDDEIQENKEQKIVEKPTPAARKKIIPVLENSLHENDTPEYMKKITVKRISMNPFEEDDDEDENDEDGNEESLSGVSGDRSGSSAPPKKLISAPRISLNPFWSDADEDEAEDDDEENRAKPVPKPRKLRNAATAGRAVTPEPKPRSSNQSTIAPSFGSNSSLSSSQSGGQSVRKKKPAPRPPVFLVSEFKTESAPNSLASSPSTSVSHSPRLGTKTRKTKKAPLPPSSTPLSNANNKELSIVDISPLKKTTGSEEWANEKVTKDKVNENRKSQSFNPPTDLTSPSDGVSQEYTPNKSTYGKWKRKKGPAPSRPVPQRRMIKALPVSEFRKELELIELQKQGLEKQGVRLEQIIRDRCEGPDRDENCIDEETVPIDVEDLILQLFEVVNEKNELSRREAELMYLQRQQRLEEEYAEVEYQIRCLMMQPEVNKTDSDKAREEELIQRLVEIVERRNEIIECLEMDRLREAEEDHSISTSLNSYASRRDEQSASTLRNAASKDSLEDTKQDENITKKEKSKKIKKEKKNKSKKSHVVDADKDVDETETSIEISPAKEKKKKKFALF